MCPVVSVKLVANPRSLAYCGVLLFRNAQNDTLMPTEVWMEGMLCGKREVGIRKVFSFVVSNHEVFVPLFVLKYEQDSVPAKLKSTK